MLKMYYYVDKNSLLFVRASQVQLIDSHLLEVPQPPENALSRWDKSQQAYIPLTEAEVGEPLTDEDNIISTPLVKDEFHFAFGYNARTLKVDWLRRQNGTSTLNRPYVVPVDCWLQTITFDSDNQPWELLLYRNRKFLKSLHKKDENYGKILEKQYISFDKGDFVSAKAATYNSKVRLKYPGCVFYFEAK